MLNRVSLFNKTHSHHVAPLLKVQKLILTSSGGGLTKIVSAMLWQGNAIGDKERKNDVERKKIGRQPVV